MSIFLSRGEDHALVLCFCIGLVGGERGGEGGMAIGLRMVGCASGRCGADVACAATASGLRLRTH